MGRPRPTWVGLGSGLGRGSTQLSTQISTQLGWGARRPKTRPSSAEVPPVHTMLGRPPFPSSWPSVLLSRACFHNALNVGPALKEMGVPTYRCEKANPSVTQAPTQLFHWRPSPNPRPDPSWVGLDPPLGLGADLLGLSVSLSRAPARELDGLLADRRCAPWRPRSSSCSSAAASSCHLLCGR